MKTFGEFMNEGKAITIEVDYIDEGDELKKFLKAGAKFKAKKVGTINGNAVIHLTGDLNELHKFMKKNYDSAMTPADLDAFAI